MSDFYSAIIFLSSFIMIIMDMLVSGNDLMEHDKKQTAYTISVLVIACMVSEWLGVWMDGADPSLRALHILVKTIELSAAPIITGRSAGSTYWPTPAAFCCSSASC